MQLSKAKWNETSSEVGAPCSTSSQFPFLWVRLRLSQEKAKSATRRSLRHEPDWGAGWYWDMHSMKSKCFQPQCMSLPFTFLDRGLENECRFSLCARVFYRVMPYITVHATLILRKVLSASRLRSVRAGTVSNASVTSSTRRRAGCRVGVRGCSRWGLGGGCWRWWKNASARACSLPLPLRVAGKPWPAPCGGGAQHRAEVPLPTSQRRDLGKVTESLRAPSVPGDNNSNYLRGLLWGLNVRIKAFKAVLGTW